MIFLLIIIIFTDNVFTQYYSPSAHATLRVSSLKIMLTASDNLTMANFPMPWSILSCIELVLASLQAASRAQTEKRKVPIIVNYNCVFVSTPLEPQACGGSVTSD